MFQFWYVFVCFTCHHTASAQVQGHLFAKVSWQSPPSRHKASPPLAKASWFVLPRLPGTMDNLVAILISSRQAFRPFLESIEDKFGDDDECSSESSGEDECCNDYENEERMQDLVIQEELARNTMTTIERERDQYSFLYEEAAEFNEIWAQRAIPAETEVAEWHD